MKKIVTLMMALALCATANAASVDWGVSRKSFMTSDGTSNQAENYYVAVFLYESLSDVNTALSTLGTAAESSITALSQLEVSNGVTNNRGAAEGSFTTDKASGTEFKWFTVVFDAKKIEDASNYLVSSASLSNAYVAPDNPANIGTFDSSSYANSSWTPIVPEPSVALMGLLGLGMLLKRRRA